MERKRGPALGTHRWPAVVAVLVFLLLGTGIVLIVLLATMLGRGDAVSDPILVDSQPRDFRAGSSAEVRMDTDLRGGPSSAGVVRADIEAGTRVTVTGNAVDTGGGVWWPVVVDESDVPGWINGDALKHPASPSTWRVDT